MKIIIFDGSFKTTPFINRLSKGLAHNYSIYILGFNEKLQKKMEGVNYIALGSNQSKLGFLFTSLGWVFRSGKIQLFLPTIQKIVQGNREAIQQQNLELAIKNISPDLIHLQWPSVIPWFEKLLLEQKTPIVLSQRGFHNNVRPFVDAENFEYLKKWYPKMAGFHSVSKAISINGDKIYTSPKKIDKVVYTGLPLEEIKFSENYSISNPLQIISIGRAHWIKGYDYALQACRLLKEKNFPFHYTIIGGANDEELQYLVENLGLKQYVNLERQIPQKNVFVKMKESSLLLMPSLEEGLPNVIVEAMAIGLPVLSTDCGGVPELILENETGWLVPTRNAKKIADSILGIANLPIEKILDVRMAARKKVQQQHSEQGMINGMEQLYSEIRNL